jgi:hypothetical protein
MNCSDAIVAAIYSFGALFMRGVYTIDQFSMWRGEGGRMHGVKLYYILEPSNEKSVSLFLKIKSKQYRSISGWRLQAPGSSHACSNDTIPCRPGTLPRALKEPQPTWLQIESGI